MLVEEFSEKTRQNKTIELNTDVTVVGGGLAGVCAAVTAARSGVKVVLVQDRPVLGGNASSEVRLWILGATSHMGNNNRYAREGGLLDEILVENLYRNKEGNALIFDTILLEKINGEKNITLLLNTAVYEVEKSDPETIKSVNAFCSQNSTNYLINAPLFCDASGDGIVGFQAGAAFRMGAEKPEEFGEKFAPDISYGELLGHTMYFYSKDAGKPVKYVAPEFALKDITEIPRYKVISEKDYGCRLWWLEYGGRKDTIHESEDIKWELWKVVYGVWDHIKNSGEFPDSENLTLEWVATIPGKRESRRFEGLYMLKQQDVIEQTNFDDAVAFGGWALDLHPSDGVYSERPGCTQYHSKGIYQIPLRSFISKNIKNLFLAGRIISASHVAFGSTRVMATCGHGGQAVGFAAAQCINEDIKVNELLDPINLNKLQQALSLNGQGVPGVEILKENNQASLARIESSSEFKLNNFSGNGLWMSLETAVSQMLPLSSNTKYTFQFEIEAFENTCITAQLRSSSKLGNYTPDTVIQELKLDLITGKQKIDIPFDSVLKDDQYGFITFLENSNVNIRCTDERITGVMTLFNGKNKAVNNHGKQIPPTNSGIEEFEFWIPKRRPEGENLAFNVSPSINLYSADNICNGIVRPFLKTNAWAADLSDDCPALTMNWEQKHCIKNIKLFFDTDYDHAMESTLMGHPESVIPFCIRNYKIYDDKDKLIYEKKNNYQTINEIKLENSISTKQLRFEFEHPSKTTPASIFEIVCS
ncbi:FAD-dependent oxidoreductase [Marinifilum sp.]|uniref:FAD-dependent oxidoreductase n=1 Tax=Marinifilum sp. TaxID=2033137 RepID=UPI003BA9E69E